MAKKGLKQAVSTILAIMMIMAISVSILPKLTYATTTEPTIVVGISGASPLTKNEFVNRHSGKLIIYNGNSYTASDFFDMYNGMEFGITRTTTGKNPSITVVLREGKTENKQVLSPTTPQIQESASATENAPDVPDIEETRSSITLPNRKLTETELNAWIAEYDEMGRANAFELEVVRLINIEREKEGLEALAISQPLMMAARFKSQEMMDLGYFEHVSPVYGAAMFTAKMFGHENTPHQTQNDNITRHGAGENLYGGAYLAERVVQGWMNSPGHRAPMMSKDTKTIGIGAIRIENTVTGRGLTTANFGY